MLAMSLEVTMFWHTPNFLANEVASAILAPSGLNNSSLMVSWPSWWPSLSHFSSDGRLKSVLGTSWAVLFRLFRRQKGSVVSEQRPRRHFGENGVRGGRGRGGGLVTVTVKLKFGR